jgi:hypothetical protein
MVGRSKLPTKAEARRMELLKTQVGCVACRLDGRGYEPPDIHHLLSGGKRIGHQATVPLCPWHHRGYGSTESGPSLARAPGEFHATYGSDQRLLEITNGFLEIIEDSIVGGPA